MRVPRKKREKKVREQKKKKLPNGCQREKSKRQESETETKNAPCNMYTLLSCSGNIHKIFRRVVHVQSCCDRIHYFCSSVQFELIFYRGIQVDCVQPNVTFYLLNTQTYRCSVELNVSTGPKGPVHGDHQEIRVGMYYFIYTGVS